MEGKRALLDSEVDEAVDTLMFSFGVAEVSPADETRFDPDEAKPKLTDGETVGGAPSGDMDALWGAPKPKKK